MEDPSNETSHGLSEKLLSSPSQVVHVDEALVSLQQHQQNGSHNNTTHLVVAAVPSSNSEYSGEKQPDGYRDITATLLFALHFVVMLYLAFCGLGSLTIQAPRFDGTETLHLGGIFLVFLLACVAALVLTSLLIAVLTRFADALIPVALYITVGSNVLLTIVLLWQRYWSGVGLALLLLVFTACYARSVWRRLPLCTALLQTAMAAIQSHVGIAIVAYGTVLLLCIYTILWILAGIGVYVHSAVCQQGTCAYHVHFMILVLLLSSYAWTAKVLMNVLHVTVSGVVASWWFAPDQGIGGLWSETIHDSLYRACTFSFGSICLSSLLTALIQLSYHGVRTAQRYSHGASLMLCVSQCLLGMLNRLVTFFHRYALVYVAVYGYDLLTAGQKTSALLASRGWMALVNDDLISRILALASWVVGACTGAFVLLTYNPNWIQDYYSSSSSSSDSSNFGLCFFLPLVIGTAVANLVVTVVASATDTILVAFAEAPIDLQRNHPGLHRQLVEAWRVVYPDEFSTA